MKEDEDYGVSGAQMRRDSTRLEQIWDEVQILNRAAGPWGVTMPDGVDIDAVHRRMAA